MQLLIDVSERILDGREERAFCGISRTNASTISIRTHRSIDYRSRNAQKCKFTDRIRPILLSMRRFGQSGTRDHIEKLQKYRNVILTKLYTFTCTFVESLRNSLNFFPTSLSFLISQMLIILSKSSELSLREIRCLCCDIIMTLFIGPAICEPEKHGIIADIPISTVARHNLNQVGHLSIHETDPVDRLDAL